MYVTIFIFWMCGGFYLISSIWKSLNEMTLVDLLRYIFIFFNVPFLLFYYLVDNFLDYLENFRIFKKRIFNGDK